MARVFISGSSTGLGLMAGQLLVEQGHRVVLHARNGKRANDARRALPRTEEIVTGDLETIAGERTSEKGWRAARSSVVCAWLKLAGRSIAACSKIPMRLPPTCGLSSRSFGERR